MTKGIQLGTMEFWLKDYREYEFNESVDCTFELWGENEDDEVMSLENYYYFCKRFAAVMGFSEKSIEEWFGKY